MSGIRDGSAVVVRLRVLVPKAGLSKREFGSSDRLDYAAYCM